VFTPGTILYVSGAERLLSMLAAVMLPILALIV